jgi:predicted  nucleic acid-binding Zn-ribbon protein
VADEFPTLEHRVDELEKHKERVEARFDGGMKAFDAIRKEIDKLVEKTTPKALPIWQILLAVFGMLGTLLGVWWSARGELDAKANAADVQAIFSPLKTEVEEQRIVLTSVKATAENTSKQVDEMKSDTKAGLSEIRTDIRALIRR